MFSKKIILSFAILIGNCAIQVKAATYTVTKLTDTADGICNADCSLREAIGVANLTVDDDVIDFAAGVTGTITVSSTLTINNSPNIGLLTINGPTIGAGIKVSGNNATKVFFIRTATTAELNFLTISDGLAPNGAGIDNQGILTINNSTISNNTATFAGGGISNGASALIINNSTISGNTVTGGANHGGGIFAFGGTVTLINSTVSNNSAASVGGVSTQSTLNLSNTIIGNNGGSNGDCNAATTNATFSLVESGNCITNGVNNNIVADAMLGPLQDNGGSTFTHAILPGSLAINAAIDCTDIAAMAVTIDQRGTNRPQGGICDIGSFEATGTFRTLTITASGPASGTVTDASGVLIDCTVTAGVTSGDCSQLLLDNSVLTLTATAEVGSGIGAWPACDNAAGNICTQTVSGGDETATVAFDFPPVNLSVSSNTGSEAAGSVITVTATASSAVSGDQTVDLLVTGAGVSVSDYSLSNTTITINDGHTTGSITFTVQDDALVEGAETAAISLTNPSAGLSLGSTVSQNIVITDSDFELSGNLSGFDTHATPGDSITLQNNGEDDLIVSADGSFNFSSILLNNAPYAVTVKTNPTMPNQTCLVSGGNSGQNDGTGQIAGSNYTDIVVTCSINQYSVGGTLSGLQNGTLTLQNNTGNDLHLSSNGAFEFTTQLDDLSSYAVTLTNNSSNPLQSCVVTGGNSGQNDGAGDIAGDNYIGINVLCEVLYHVDMNAADGGDGYSWDTAFNNLQDALEIAVSGDEIWVAQGVYYPDVGGTQVDNDRLASFTLIDGVSVYGGFNATETLLTQRNPEINVTILSGDIGQDDGNSDGNFILEDRLEAVGLNSFNIIYGADVDTLTVFSGFTVTAGQADGVDSTTTETSGAGMFCGSISVFPVYSPDFSGPSINKSTFIGNSASSGGAATLGCSQDVRESNFINNGGPAVRASGGYYDNVLFQGNTSQGGGGALSNIGGPITIVNSKFISNQSTGDAGAIWSSRPITLDNVLFSGNKASNYGGALFLLGNNTQNYTNVTMTGNIAGQQGGAIRLSPDINLNLRNSIIWNNHDNTTNTTITSSIYKQNGGAGVYTQINSLVQNYGITGVGNLDEDPLFVTDTDPTTAPTVLGNARLQFASMAIDAGDEGFVTLGAKDLDNNDRIFNGDVDMGAYESSSSNTVSVIVNGLGAGSLVLQNKGTDDLTFDNDGTLVFTTPVTLSDNYLVTVFSQPTTPSQECVVSNQSGIINGSNVSVAVVCTINQFDINVQVTGLDGSNTLDFTNDANTHQSTADETFTLSILDDLTAYDVAFTSSLTSPVQTCSASSNASGNLSGANLTVVVTCVTTKFDINVQVTGLDGSNTIDFTNGANTHQSTFDETFILSTLDDLTAYDVTFTSSLTSPVQTCSASANASGNLTGDDLTVVVTCVTTQYNVGVDVSGLANANSVILDNNGEGLTVTADGQSNFATALDDGSAYDVTVTSQPTTPNQICLVTAGSDNLSGADVLLTVICTTNQYFVGGMASGLAISNSVTLSQGAENLSVNSNAAFVFLDPLTDESNYTVSVANHPTQPNQTCALVNPTGTIAGNDISDIEVNCTTNQYLIGGFVTGLHSGNNLIVQNNNGDDLTVISSGDFDFATAIDDLQSYNVSIFNQPTNPMQPCVISNNSGNVAGAAVTTVSIVCEFGDDLIYKSNFE